MNASDFMNFQELVHTIGWTLLHSLWQGAVIVLLAFAVLALMKRASSSLRYTVSCFALFAIPVTAVLTFIILENRSLPADLTSVNAGNMTHMFSSIGGSGEAIQPVQGIAFKERILVAIDDCLPWLVASWLAGLLFLMIRQLGGIIYIRRISKKHSRPVPEAIRNMADRIAARMNHFKPFSVLESIKVRVPVAIGYLRPVIILPLGMAGSVPYAQIESILVHELAHIYRKDYIVNILQSVIEAVFFFNPAMWWLSGNIRKEREHACDDITMTYIQDPIIYIKALTQMEDRTSLNQSLVPALAGGRKSLLERIRRVAGMPGRQHRFPGFMIPSLILVSGMALIVVNTSFTVDKDTVESFNRAFYSAGLSATPETQQSVMNSLPWNILKGTSGPSSSIGLPLVVTDTTKDQEMKEEQRAYIEEARARAREAREKLDEARKAFQEAREEYSRAYRQQRELNRDDMERLSGEIHKKVLVIRNGDSLIVRVDSTSFPFEFYGWDGDLDSMEIPGHHGWMMPPDLRFDYVIPPEEPLLAIPPEEWDSTFEYELFVHPEDYEIDEEALQHEMEKAQDELARVQHEMQQRQMEMERGNREMKMRQERFGRGREKPVFRYSEWPGEHQGSTEKIIRQELREDGLISRGRSYIVEISGNGLFINGEKQSRDLSRKYKKLYEGLEGEELNSGNTFKLVF